jgi:hypothetical protein
VQAYSGLFSQIPARILSLVIFCAVMFATFFQASEVGSLAWFGEHFPLAPFLATTILLLLGIIFGSIFRNISQMENKEVDIIHEARRVFKEASFWTSVCVSPFVFFAVYAVIRSSPSDPASYLLAFQNGFFCESVFKRLTSGDESRAGAAGNRLPPAISTPTAEAPPGGPAGA